MANLTPTQLTVLRQCPERPGVRFPSDDAENLALQSLSALGLVRRVPYYKRDRKGDGRRIPGCGWQRTKEGTARAR